MVSPTQKIELLLINGETVLTSVNELRQLLWSKSVLFMVSGAVLVLLIGDPYIFSAFPSKWSRMFYWSFGIILYLLTLPFYLGLFYRLWHSITNRRLFHFGPTIPLTIGLTYFLLVLKLVLGSRIPEVTGPITPVILTLNVMIATMLECIGLYWIYPTFLSAKRAPPSRREFVHINGVDFPLLTVKLVKSDARYLIVTTDSGTSRHLCRMRDFLAQVSEDDGLSPHRSYWVARSNIIGLSGNRIKLLSGETVPVSRGKVETSRKWLKHRGFQH